MSLSWTSYSATDVGLVRPENQDSILVDSQKGLFVVADGMGGHRGGAEASRMAVQIIAENFKALKDPQEAIHKEDIREVCLKANQAIWARGQKDITLKGMGTTLSLLSIHKTGQATIANIGDSRVYMNKNDHFWLLTEDHNFLTQQLKACFLSKESLPEPSAEDDILTKSVGFFPAVEPDIFEKTVQKGEQYLICSDGLSGFVTDRDIHAILKENAGQDVPKECIKKALMAGGGDNVSVIIVEIH